MKESIINKEGKKLIGATAVADMIKTVVNSLKEGQKEEYLKTIVSELKKEYGSRFKMS